VDRLRYISVHNYEYILGSQCTSYLQQHKLVLTCVAWEADRKDAVLHKVELKCESSIEKQEGGRYKVKSLTMDD
jgi:hypothetical protein